MNTRALLRSARAVERETSQPLPAPKEGLRVNRVGILSRVLVRARSCISFEYASTHIKEKEKNFYDLF